MPSLRDFPSPHLPGHLVDDPRTGNSRLQQDRADSAGRRIPGVKTTKVAMRHVQDLGDSIVSVEDSDTGRKDLPAQWTIPILLRMHGQAGDKAMPDGTDMGSDKRQSAGPLRLNRNEVGDSSGSTWESNRLRRCFRDARYAKAAHDRTIRRRPYREAAAAPAQVQDCDVLFAPQFSGDEFALRVTVSVAGVVVVELETAIYAEINPLDPGKSSCQLLRRRRCVGRPKIAASHGEGAFRIAERVLHAQLHPLPWSRIVGTVRVR